MSGHSKWNNIKRKKEKTDGAKAKVFTKIGREISVAVRTGGPNPASNSKLADLIAKAKRMSVPNDNIQRIIKKADGDGFLLQFVDDGLKAFDHRCQTFVQVVGVRRQRDGIDDEFVGLHGAEHQVRAACVECDDHTVVVSVHGILVICWLWL